MWTFIIILVVGIILKFLYDSNKQTSNMEKRGGIKEVYSELVHQLTCEPYSKLIRQTATNMHIMWEGDLHTIEFVLMDTFNVLHVHAHIQNAIDGKTVLKWEFDQSWSQQKMFLKMETDINFEMENK